MGTMINRRRVCGGKSLPYDADIEYLGFVQNCIIDTSIKPSTNYKYCWKYLWLNTMDWVYPFLNSDTSRGNWFIFGGIEERRETQLHIKDSYNLNGSAINTNTLYEGSFMHNGNNMEVRLNNTLMVSLPYIDFQASSPLRIILTSNVTVNIYGFSIYDDDNVLILDFIPVRVGTTGYMYDKVSGQFFGNAGTGNFILGPDV